MALPVRGVVAARVIASSSRGFPVSLPQSPPPNDRDKPTGDWQPPSAPAETNPEATPSFPHNAPPLAAGPGSTMPGQAAAAGPLPQIPGYVVVRRIGKGGMGEVFEVINRLGRRFALKVIRPELCDTDLQA